ncbi:hypothetical protein BLNAU_13696 [Blattamonas nauphoetae]|uniref:Uncharacterized protein n=1 Tax=Blattamonas nauphoetae TaxID=2049346 RepID=A0ABQ9XIW6_9EUKA|nr:hypothetical protein BLNAU_13696 [Blattamonas nauphoetae]
MIDLPLPLTHFEETIRLAEPPTTEEDCDSDTPTPLPKQTNKHNKTDSNIPTILPSTKNRFGMTQMQSLGLILQPNHDTFPNYFHQPLVNHRDQDVAIVDPGTDLSEALRKGSCIVLEDLYHHTPARSIKIPRAISSPQPFTYKRLSPLNFRQIRFSDVQSAARTQHVSNAFFITSTNLFGDATFGEDVRLCQSITLLRSSYFAMEQNDKLKDLQAKPAPISAD